MREHGVIVEKLIEAEMKKIPNDLSPEAHETYVSRIMLKIKKKIKDSHFSHRHLPIFDIEPINYILDALHLLLRMVDFFDEQYFTCFKNVRQIPGESKQTTEQKSFMQKKKKDHTKILNIASIYKRITGFNGSEAMK